MRIIKLSKEVSGFENIEACKSYFKYVLPWQKLRFNIVGDGLHIAQNKLDHDEIVLFSYDGNCIAVGKVENLIVEKNKSIAIQLQEKKLKVFESHFPLKELEDRLRKVGYVSAVTNTQGWNILKDKHEEAALKFIIKKDWEDYL